MSLESFNVPPKNNQEIFSLEEMKNTLEKIENSLKEGYFLHGTKLDSIEILKPKQANDSGVEGGPSNMKGVYAENKDFRIPIIMALFDKVDRNAPATMGYSAYGEEFSMGVERTLQIKMDKNTTFTDGYVYILPPDTFKLYEDDKTKEYVSIEPVLPKEKVLVKPEILNLLKNIEIKKI